MLNSIIEFIQNSVTTVIGLAVGVLGVGGSSVLNTQTANISDTLPALTEEVNAVGGGGDGEAVASSDIPVETEYFERTNLPTAVFTRPTTEEKEKTISSEENTPALIQETELIRSINPIKSTKKSKEVDVSVLLNVDFDKFKPNLKITKITEDNNSFYSSYQFNSFAIRNNVWQEVVKEKQISVTKIFLGNQDLGDYLSRQLGEVVDNEIVFLKEVQTIQKAKTNETEEIVKTQSPTKASDYNALIGKVLNVENGQFDNYTSQKTHPQTTTSEISTTKTTTTGVVDNEAPLIIIQGNNPALIQQGSSYSDLGAQVTDNLSNNLGVVIGGEMVNTEEEGSYFVTYTATDEAGNVATATREVIVYAYDVVPEVEPVVEEEVPMIVPEVVVEPEPVIEPIVEEVIVPEETPVISPVVEEEITDIATTTETMVAKTPPVELINNSLSSTEVMVETANVVVENVVEGGKQAGKKIKETVEAVSEVTTVVAETVSEVTTDTLEQVSAGIETVAEEVSALIKKVNFWELIGNVKSALQGGTKKVESGLQASISTAGNEAGDMFETIGKFFRPITEGFQSGIEVLKNAPKKVFEKVGLEKIIYQAPEGVLANISDFNKNSDLIEEEYFKSQEKSFFSFAVEEINALPSKLADKISDSLSVLTATISNTFDFFKTHRPK